MKIKFINFFNILILCYSGGTFVHAQVIQFKNTPKRNDVIKILKEELNRYPQQIITKYLHKVTFKELEYSSGLAFLDYEIVIDPRTDLNYIRHIIHHELSSVLLNRIDENYTFVTFNRIGRKFIDLNDTLKYFSTAESGHTGQLKKMESNYFVGSEYARVGFENDWNMTCEYLWTNSPIYLKDGTKENFWDFYIKKKGLPVAKKIEMALDFYRSLDKSLTIEFFKSLPSWDIH